MSVQVSVIIPTFNSSKTIDRTLASVFMQTAKPYEIIIVDDGSSDDTVEKINNHKGKIKIVRQNNSGAAAARNRGVMLASGQVIAFLDSDDIWHPRKLEYQARIFSEFEDVGICSTGWSTCSDNNQLIINTFLNSKIDALPAEKIAFSNIFLRPYLATPTVLIRKKTFELLGGFDELLETAEDVDLWMRACYMTSYALIENVLCYVVLQENSLSKRSKVSTHENHLKVIEKFCRSRPDFARDHNKLVSMAKSIIYTQWGSAELCQNHLKSAGLKLILSMKFKMSSRAAYLCSKVFLLWLKSLLLNNKHCK